MKIKLYGRKGHAHSVAYRNFLKSTELPFEYKDVSIDEEAKKHSKELYDGAVKYPTLFVDEEVYLTPTSDDFNKIMKNLNLRA